MRNNDTGVLSRTEFMPDDHKLQGIFSLAAFATIKAKEIAYVSVPITSGKRLYDFMTERKYRTIDEAKNDAGFFEQVVKPNLADGVETSNSWADKIDGAVIAPAEFEKRLRGQHHNSWGQDAFMSMWIPLIDEKITHMIMVDGWEYSNGSGEEYLQAVVMQMGRGRRTNIEIFDENGKTMTIDRGIGLMVDAFKRVHAMGIRPRNMAETLAQLLEMEHRFNFENTQHRSIEPNKRMALNDSVKPYDRAKLKAAREELGIIFKQHYPDILPILKKTSSFDFSPLSALFRDPPKPASLVRKFA